MSEGAAATATETATTTENPAATGGGAGSAAATEPAATTTTANPMNGGVAPSTDSVTGGGGGVPANWASQLSAENQNYVQAKGFQDVENVLTSYRNLEKLIGQKENILQLPKDKTDQKAWADLYSKLGRPEKADAYEVNVPEGGDPNVAAFSKEIFHEANLTVEQAKILSEKWTAKMSEMAQTEQQNKEIEHNKQFEKLKREWGDAYNQNLGLAKSAAKKLGIDGATVDALETAMGFAKTMEFFHQVGARTGEADFVASEGGGTG